MALRQAKAVRLGNSLAVVLPKDWTRGMGVKPGDLLSVEYGSECVIVQPLMPGGIRDGRRTPGPQEPANQG